MQTDNVPDIAAFLKVMRVKLAQAIELNQQLGATKMSFKFPNPKRSVLIDDRHWITERLEEEFIKMAPPSSQPLHSLRVTDFKGGYDLYKSGIQYLRLEVTFAGHWN